MDNEAVILSLLLEIKDMLQEIKDRLPAKKKSAPKTEVVADICYFPTMPELDKKFHEFIEWRRHELKKPMGDRAISMTVNQLTKHSEREGIEALDQSMRNSYQGVFFKGDKNTSQQTQTQVNGWLNA